MGVADIIMMVEEIIGRKRMVLMIDNLGCGLCQLNLSKSWVGYTVVKAMLDVADRMGVKIKFATQGGGQKMEGRWRITRARERWGKRDR